MKHALLTFKVAAALCRCSEADLREAQNDGRLLTIPGCDGPDSDRIQRDDLAAYQAHLKLAHLAPD